jgi:hypothetical protein
MKKNDWILVAAILVLAGIGFLIYTSFGRQTAGIVKVTVNGELFGTYSLEKEQEIKINDTNRMIIKDGQADMIEADCPDQICVDHKTISKNKETIVCLPNKVLIEIVGGEHVEIDAVAN